MPRTVRWIRVLVLLGAFVFFYVNGGGVVPQSSVETSGVFYGKVLVPTDQIIVEKVVDGDTIDVLQNGKKIRVRLLGINTPETVDPRKPVECFGREASDKMKELVSGHVVRLETDVSQENTDKYGRMLAYVYLPDGTFVNQRMIAEGFAHEYTYRVPYHFQKEFKKAESSARSARLGLWSPATCATGK